MCDWVRRAVANRLHGVHIHVDPLKAVEGLSDGDAARIPCDGGRSPLELLFHIVFWQEYSLGLLRGSVSEYVEGMDWDVGGKTWSEMVEQFNAGFSFLESIARDWELEKEVRISDELVTCVGAEVLGTIQHTSYHLGQLVSARRCLGLWPRQ